MVIYKCDEPSSVSQIGSPCWSPNVITNKIKGFCRFIFMGGMRASGLFSKGGLFTMKQMASFINEKMGIQNFKISKVRVP